jgi:hypothetical protein
MTHNIVLYTDKDVSKVVVPVNITQLVRTLLYAGVGVQTPDSPLIHIKDDILVATLLDRKKNCPKSDMVCGYINLINFLKACQCHV